VPGIGDREHQRFVFAGGRDPDRAAFGERPDAVLDRVLDERREHHRGSASLEQRRGTSIELARRAPMRISVRPGRPKRARSSSARETSWSRIRGSAARRYGQGARACAPRAGVALAQAPHIGESIEQEMRFDLRLQEAQLRLELLLLERCALQLGGVDLLAHRPGVQIEDVARDQHRAGTNQVMNALTMNAGSLRGQASRR